MEEIFQRWFSNGIIILMILVNILFFIKYKNSTKRKKLLIIHVITTLIIIVICSPRFLSFSFFDDKDFLLTIYLSVFLILNIALVVTLVYFITTEKEDFDKKFKNGIAGSSKPELTTPQLLFALNAPENCEIQDFFKKYKNHFVSEESETKKLREIANPNYGYSEEDQRIAKVLLQFRDNLNSEVIERMNRRTAPLRKHKDFWETHFKDVPENASREVIENILSEIACSNNKYSNYDKQLAKNYFRIYKNY